jgi:ribonuclease BN (tRNA processing enzyme)
MKLIVLGSGTSVPHPARAAPAHWVETAAGAALLDCGADAAHRMAAQHLAWERLAAIWISHFHLDHVGGLLPFLFGTKYAPQTQIRRHPLIIYGPQGLKRLIERLDAANDYGLMDQPFPLEIKEVLPGERFELLPDLTAQPFKTPHTSESLGLKLWDRQGRSLVYTADTGYDERLSEEARDASLLLIECSFRRNKPVTTHLEFSEAIEIARGANVRWAVLVHLYPEMDEFDAQTEAKVLWTGKTLAAYDGLTIEL